MLTLFTITKSFSDPHIARIQRNAFGAWKQMQPTPEVIVFGNAPGTAEACDEFGFQHVPTIRRGETGMELVSDAFYQAWDMAANDLCMYVNGDIIMPPFFPSVAMSINAARYLAVGQRRDTPIDFDLTFEPGWWGKLKAHTMQHGTPHSLNGVDWFLHQRAALAPLPDLYVGTWFWDGVVLGLARQRGIPIIDATDAALTLHQDHSYRHYPGELQGIAQGPESAHNHKHLPGGRVMSIGDADVRLIPAF